MPVIVPLPEEETVVIGGWLAMSNNANKMHRFNIIISVTGQNDSLLRTSTGCWSPSFDDEDMTSGNSNTANGAARMEISRFHSPAEEDSH